MGFSGQRLQLRRQSLHVLLCIHPCSALGDDVRFRHADAVRDLLHPCCRFFLGCRRRSSKQACNQPLRHHVPCPGMSCVEQVRLPRDDKSISVHSIFQSSVKNNLKGLHQQHFSGRLCVGLLRHVNLGRGKRWSSYLLDLALADRCSAAEASRQPMHGLQHQSPRRCDGTSRFRSGRQTCDFHLWSEFRERIPQCVAAP